MVDTCRWQMSKSRKVKSAISDHANEPLGSFSMPTTLQTDSGIHSYIHSHTHTAKVERERRERGGERTERRTTHLNFL